MMPYTPIDFLEPETPPATYSSNALIRVAYLFHLLSFPSHLKGMTSKLIQILVRNMR